MPIPHLHDTLASSCQTPNEGFPFLHEIFATTMSFVGYKSGVRRSKSKERANDSALSKNNIGPQCDD